MKSGRFTVAAIAIVAMAAATVLHEAIGHGGACLALGGKVTRLTSVFFNCQPPSPWIDAGGPAGSLLGALLGWLALRTSSAEAPRARLFALLLFAFCALWFSGQLVYQVLLDKGDFAFAAKGLAPNLARTTPFRLLAAALGVALYMAAARIVARHAEMAGGSLRSAWLAATLGAMIAAALYAPDRLGAIKEAFFEIGAASIPLVWIGRRATAGAVVKPSAPWVIGAGLVYAGFVLTLGLGLP